MTLTKFTQDIAYHSKLDDNPNDVDGLTAIELKAKYDQGVLDTQAYINSTLIPEVEEEFNTLETKDSITNNRKLSPDGDFRGTWNGVGMTAAEPGLSSAFNAHVEETKQYEGKKFQINNPYRSGGLLPLKGQLHCHTTNSDGVDTPTALVTAYKNAGYNFIAITDHDFVTLDPGISGIIFLQSVEESNTRHVTAYDISVQSLNRDTQSVINEHRKNGKMCSIAHPHWVDSPIGDVEMLSYYNNNFIEVFNSGGLAEDYWDNILTSGRKTFALSVDDCHDVSGNQFNKGWVVANAYENTKEAILKSLRDGNFYASTGNDISITVEGNTIIATSTENSHFTFIGENGRTLQTNDSVREATYTINGDELYVRVKSAKVSDSTIAWSQPVFIDCLGDDSRSHLTMINKYIKNDPKENCLINYDFRNPVNQRGITTLSAGNTQLYFIDCWYTSRTNITVNTDSLSVSWDGINGVDGWIQQKIEKSASLIGKTVTVSAEIDEKIYSATLVVPTTADTTAFSPYTDNVKFAVTNFGNAYISVTIFFNSNAVKKVTRAKLEIGYVSTLISEPPTKYGEQLALCQRYCVPVIAFRALTGFANSSKNVYAAIELPNPMRSAPTLSGVLRATLRCAGVVVNNAQGAVQGFQTGSDHVVGIDFGVQSTLTASSPVVVEIVTQGLFLTAEL